MNNIPFNLKILDTCLPDYFQGFSGPVISFPVDARTTYSELFKKLTDDDAWPSNADIEDIRIAVIDLVGQVHSEDSRPYFDIGPGAPPSTHFVSSHPSISDMWMVIDKEDGEVMGSWTTEKEANIAAWDESDEESPPEVYAYFGIELELPAGYQVGYAPEDAWSWTAGEEEYENYFDTEMEAKVAAWRDSFANEPPAEFLLGPLDGPNSSDIWTAGISHTQSPGSQGGVWHNRIEVYGHTEQDAVELRGRILKALNA